MLRRTVALALSIVMAPLLISCVTKPVRPLDSEVPGIFFDDPALFVLDDREALRRVSAETLEITKSFEKFRESPYNDPVQFCTIAYGHLIVRQPCGPAQFAQYPTPLTEPQGLELLGKDMRFAEIAVIKGVTAELTEGQFGALSDFTFNVGATNFMNSRLRKLVNKGALEEIAAEFRRWRRGGGVVLNGLVRRREAEIKLFFKGIELPRDLTEEPPTRKDIDIFTGREVR